MFKKLNFALYLSSTIIITLGLSISLQSLLAAWTAPTSLAPAGNVYPPINEGLTDQAKLGGLGIGGNFAVSGNSSFIGNIGIGTTSPSFKLEIHAGAGADGIYLKNGLNNIGSLTRYVSSDSGVLELYDSNAPKIKLNAKANVDSYINNGGKVGIGTASPLSQLSVGASGETNSTLYAYSFNSKAVHGYTFGGGGIGVYGSGGGYGVYGTSTTYSIYGDNGNSSGYSVYARQTNPNGYAIFANGGLNYFSGSIRIGVVSVAMYNHKLAVQGSNSDSSKFALYVENSSSNPLLAVRNDGNVGIGTTNPGIYKLNVVGDAYVSGNNGNVLTKTSTGGVTNDGLPNCAAGAYLKWDGAKWICAMSPSGDKHYFITSSIYDGNLGGYSGANDKCNADSSALPGKAYYAAMGTAQNGWGMTGVQYFNIIYGKGEVMINCYSDAASFPSFWLDFTGNFGSCSGWTTTGDIGGYGRFIANCNGAIGMGEVFGIGNTDSCTNKKPLLCVEY